MEEESTTPFTNQKAGEAFLIGKDGPGVLVLHSWWGMTPWLKNFCEKVSLEGYTVLAPDLLGGQQPTTETEAETALQSVNPDELSGLVMSSAQTLRAASRDATKPIAVIGFSMGASLGLWLSARMATSINAVVTFYGSQAIDFDDATATYLGHFAEDDHMVADDDKITTESFIRLGGKETMFYTYPDTKHWFFEEGANFNAEAAGLAWQRTVDFLQEHRP